MLENLALQIILQTFRFYNIIILGSNENTGVTARKGKTGIGKKSGGKVSGRKKSIAEDPTNLPQTLPAVAFEGDDANMSCPVSPMAKSKAMISDGMNEKGSNDNESVTLDEYDLTSIKIEANSMSSLDVFKSSAAAAGGLSSAIFDQNSLSSNASISLPIAVKSEALYDSNSQPALGAATSSVDTWKCNQCKVAFESGPQLLEHLDDIRRADHKVLVYICTFPNKKYKIMIYLFCLIANIPKFNV